MTSEFQLKQPRRKRQRRSGHPLEPLEPSLRIVALSVMLPNRERDVEFALAFCQMEAVMKRIARMIFFRCGVSDPDEASEHAFSDWYTRMLKAGFRNWDQSRPFFPFGYFTFCCSCNSYLRGNQRRSVALNADVACDQPGVIERRETTERQVALLREIEKLPVHLRNAIKGGYLEGRSAAEVAAEENTTAAIIHQRCHAGRKKLAKALRGFDPRV